MSSEQIPPSEAEGGAEKPWRKPKLHLMDFASTKGALQSGTRVVVEGAPP